MLGVRSVINVDVLPVLLIHGTPTSKTVAISKHANPVTQDAITKGGIPIVATHAQLRSQLSKGAAIVFIIGPDEDLRPLATVCVPNGD